MNVILEKKYTLLSSNKVDAYFSPREGFDEMLRAISSATETIYFAGYCFAPGDLIKQFEKSLVEAAKRGVITYVLADHHGSNSVSKNTIDRLSKHGVIWTFYRPLNILNALKYDLRLHKKLLIIDNKIAYTGGLGIYDAWIKSVDKYPQNWSDTHFKIEGPVVNDMQKSFIESWNKCSPNEYKLAFNPEAVDKLENIGIAPINSPHSIKTSRAGSLYIDMVDSAEESIYATTAYFGPPKKLRRSLRNAAKRGVKVSLLLNGKYNTHNYAAEAGRRWYKELIDVGVNIYEYQPTKIHSKLITVDGQYTSIGSGNMNFRSFYTDAEFNLLIKDSKFSSQIVNQFNESLKLSRQISTQDIQKVGVLRRVYRFGVSQGRIFF